VTLVRGLRRWDLVALVINSVVGAGIFGLPSQVFALTGTFSLAAYAVAALAIGLIVLCFAEVGSRFGATGGPYLYTRVAFGPLIGFQVGWLMWIARLTGLASLTNLFVTYLALFVPAASGGVSRAMIIALIVAILSIINIVGVRASATVTNVLTAGKLIPLFLLAAAGLFLVDPQRYSLAAAPAYGAFSNATLLLVFAYMGFEGAVIPSGEMRDPQRHLPFSLVVGMALVAVLYIGVQAVCIGTVPELARSERPLSDAALQIVGPAGAVLMAAAALVSIGGTLNAIVFATPRLLFAMADNGELPRLLSQTHARFRTPAAAIIVTAAAAGVVAEFSTFISALTISTIVRLVAYIATCVALPALRRRSDVPAPVFRTPGGWLVPAGAVALGVWLLSNTAWAELRLGAIAVMIGVAIYLAYTRPSRSTVMPRPPSQSQVTTRLTRRQC
jgi:basic amino acid/polyamine antiporter, APA family